MTWEQWKTIKHFRKEEFDSPDSPGSGDNMQYDFVMKLDVIREKLGVPMKVVSGYRTFGHNAQVGGVDGSAHENGWAADIFCRTSYERFRLVNAALDHFDRIGIGKTFIHLDADPSKPKNVVWLYD